MENNNEDKKSLVSSDADPSSGHSPISGSNCLKIPVSPWPVYAASILFFVPLAINITSFEAMLYDKLCYKHFANLSLCSNRTFTMSHPDLQKQEAMWSNYVSVLQLPLAILSNMILSSYCDKVGHKLPLILPILGSMLSTIYLALLATTKFLSWPMTTVLVYPILSTLFGGYPMLIMSAFSYVALITPEEKRPFHMAISEGTLLFGVLIGTTINGFIIDDFGLDKLAYITAGITVLPLIITVLFVTDVTSTNHSYTWRDIIGISHILDAFKTVYKKRPGYSRLLLNLSFVMYCFVFLAIQVLMAGSFLYFVKQRGLTYSQYSIFNGYTSAMKSIGGPLVVYIIKRFFKPDDFHFAIGCATSMAIGYTVMSINSIPYSMWIGGTFWLTQTSLFAIIRTTQTTICSKDELGKLFAFDAILQCVLSQTTTIAGKVIYTWSLSFWPGLFLAICAFLIVCSMISIAVYAYFHEKNLALSPKTLDQMS